MRQGSTGCRPDASHPSARCYEHYREVVASETYRDLLKKQEKFGLIGSVELWIGMRDVRNRIVHDCLPEQLKVLFELMTGVYASELLTVSARIKNDA